jgi:tropomyosin
MILEKDQEITSLQHRLSIIDTDLERAETKLSELKSAHDVGETSREANDNLNRKIQLLEEELDAAEKNVKETVEKSVCFLQDMVSAV